MKNTTKYLFKKKQWKKTMETKSYKYGRERM